MKKIISILIVFALLMLGYQVIINFFISSYSISYSLINSDSSFNIDEKYYKGNNYDFIVNDDKKNTYIFSSVYDFNKQKRVVKDIAYYSSKDVSCILPIYKRGYLGDISCYYKGSQVSLSYLESINVSTDKIIDKMSEYGYKKVKNDTSFETHNLNNNSVANVYDGNVDDDYIFPIWNYNGIFYIEKPKVVEKNYLDVDVYDNSNSYLMGKYYFIFNFQDSSSLSDLIFINLEDKGKTTLTFSSGLSSDMYINGSYNNKLYVTDLKEKIEYSLDPKSEKIEVVGEEDSFINVVDGKLVTVNKRDFFSDKKYFDIIKNDELKKKYGDIEFRESGNYYYFLKNNEFYKVYKDNIEKPIKLVKTNKVVDWKANYNELIYIENDTLYLYTEGRGVRPIVKNSEFKFNYKNMGNFYKKF